MSPLVTYTLARVGLFIAAAAVLLVLPLGLSLLLRLGIAVLISAVLSYFLLRPLRDRVADQLATAAQRRAARKESLRRALSGEDGDDESGR
jgi:hypothetical protein